MKGLHFTQDNTDDYTDDQLVELNAAMASAMLLLSLTTGELIELDSDDYKSLREAIITEFDTILAQQ